MAAIVAKLPSSTGLQASEPSVPSKSFLESVNSLSSSSTVVSIESSAQAPFPAIRRLFDHLRTNPDDAAALNATYPKRGIYKTAATHNSTSDQKFTVDLSPIRSTRIPGDLHATLSDAGLNEVLEFFDTVNSSYVAPVLTAMGKLAGADMSKAHRQSNVNFRLCDYNPQTAAPDCDNGCGEHTDYGTFSIIFQDGTPGLELEDAEAPGTWIPVPGDATVILAGWCAVIFSGGRIRATRHRVRRIPGVRRLSAVLFVAPDLDAKLMPIDKNQVVRPFSEEIMSGKLDVEWFKKVMGKKWRHREGNEELPAEEKTATQDSEIEKLIWA